MTPILGILASGMSGNLWAPGKDFDSIATTTVGAGGASTITFSSIPSTYRHLQIRLFAQTNRATYCRDSLNIIFNSDSGSNYASHSLYGDGANAGAGGGATQTLISAGTIGTSAVLSSLMFGERIIDVLDYANTSKYKTVRTLGGVDMNGTGTGGIGGLVDLTSGLWQSTNAISTIVLTPAVGTNFNQYSSFALYGIK
jgi:hypothetical protein